MVRNCETDRRLWDGHGSVARRDINAGDGDGAKTLIRQAVLPADRVPWRHRMDRQSQSGLQWFSSVRALGNGRCVVRRRSNGLTGGFIPFWLNDEGFKPRRENGGGSCDGRAGIRFYEVRCFAVRHLGLGVCQISLLLGAHVRAWRFGTISVGENGFFCWFGVRHWFRCFSKKCLRAAWCLRKSPPLADCYLSRLRRCAVGQRKGIALDYWFIWARRDCCVRRNRCLQILPH